MDQGNLTALLIVGLLSSVLSVFAYLPYLKDTWNGNTQPQRASWLIWSVLGSIAFFSQLYEGAMASLWFAGVQVSGTVSVFLLSVRRGLGQFLRRSDCCVLVLAAAGLWMWYMTDNAAWALAMTISISLLGGCLTAMKAYSDPHSETLSTWVLSFLAAALAMLAVGELDPVLLAYPVYLFTLYAIFITAIVLGRWRAFLAQSRDR